jgi:hypothetical protein
VYQSTSSNERDDHARRLLHELANDLAAIQMRADILLSVASTSVGATPPLKTDLVILRASAQHAVALTEEFALAFIGVGPSGLDEPEV